MHHRRFSQRKLPRSSRRGARLRAALLLLAIMIAPPSARAQTGKPFELTWQAPPACPTGAEVEREIARLIGDASRHRATVRATAEVTRRDDDWRVQIRFQDGDHLSERSFDGASCRAVTKVASLIIALAIEPNAGATPEVASATPREKPEPPPSPPVRSTAPPEAPLRGFAALGPVLELRVLPRAGFGLQLGLGVRVSSLSLELSGSGLLPQPTDLPSSDAGGRFSLVTVGLRLCARATSRSPEIFGCAAGLVDRVHADGYGVTAPGSATALLGTVALGPRIDFVLSEALRLGLAADATYALSEANFRLDNVGNVHRTPLWGGSARAHVVWLF